MFPTSLPPNGDSPALAAAWARSVALAEFPQFADGAEVLARYLVAQALPDAPPPSGSHLRLAIGLAAEGVLRVEVDAPFSTRHGGDDWTGIYAITRTFESTVSADGHRSWAELRDTP